MTRQKNEIDQKPLHTSDWTTIPIKHAKTKKVKKTIKTNNTNQAKNNKKTTPVNNEDYWSEIASVCVDGESLRLQKDSLENAQKILEMTSIHDATKIHFALENVHLFAGRVAMLLS